MKSSLLSSTITHLLVFCVALQFRGANGHAKCGTPHPTENQRKELKRALAKPYVATKRNAAAATTKQATSRCVQCHDIDVIIHVVDTVARDSFGTEITPSILENEFRLLNDAFATSAFKFNLKSTTLILNDTLALGNPDEKLPAGAAIQRALGEYRIGGPDTCNVYYTKGTCETAAGFASSPDGYFMYPVGEYDTNHHIFMCEDQITTPESLIEEETYYTTLIHEVGHWMGLDHTFADLDCNGEGDLVDDTPAMGEGGESNSQDDDNCEPVDTCPNQPGLDPIDNFMSYSPDKCQNRFTPGQLERTYIQFDEHYRKLESCGVTPTIELEFLFDADPNQNEIEFNEWGEDDDTADEYNLKEFDMNGHDYTNKLARFKNCFDPRSLYRFSVRDTGNNGIQAPGFFKLTANGRELFTKSTFTGEAFNAFFSLDATECATDHERFGLELTFDAFATETSWKLTSDATGQVACDYTTTLPFNETTYEYDAVLKGTTLYVDCCVPAETMYTFTISDSAGDGIPEGGYRLLVGGTEVASSNGDFETTKTESVTVGKSQSTVAPVTPTAAPVTPTVAPTVGAPAPPAFCFAGSSNVVLKNGGTVNMDQLQIGDLVQTGPNTFEPVYSFGHRNKDQIAAFLKIATSSETVLELSADHMLFVKDVGFAPASTLRKGDALIAGQGHEVIVKHVQSTKSMGVYAPFTPSGKIVVDDVLASCFIAFGERTALFSLFSFQWLAHSFEFPHRLVCHHIGSCPNESYTTEGISTWVNTSFRFASRVMQENGGVFKTFCLIVFVLLGLVFGVLEFMLFNPLFAAVTVASLLLFSTAPKKEQQPV